VPAPNTSTLVIPDVEPSGCMPTPPATALPTTAATRSANAMTASGTSHSTGDRYVAISSRATTVAVTASSVMLAPENEFAMSAPKAGPPVTSTWRSSGIPAFVAVRRSLTASLSANPDNVESNETVATAAFPSCETPTGCCLIAPRSAGERGAPSRRLNTRIAGTRSPPGNWARTASARADSALAGRGTGDCWLESSLPIRNISAPEAISTASASSHDSRPVIRPIFQILNC
jgi:hypothetical protein